MKLERQPVAKLKKEIIKIVGKYLDLKKHKVFFFGSRVAGRSHERSDIDVGIEGQRSVPWQIMSKIREDIQDLPILYTIEIVDFKEVSKDFRSVALKKIEFIN